MTTGELHTITVDPFGDSAAMVAFPDDEPEKRRTKIVAFRDRFLARLPPGVTDVVSGLESLLIEFDPIHTTVEHVAYAARILAEPLPSEPTSLNRSPRQFAVPVIFDDESAPDLVSVAEEVGMSPEAVVEALASSTFTISLLGAAMAPMMAGLNIPRPVRRRAEPRADVVPGSVMIAGNNAIIQPFPGPTGWRVVGRTPHTIVDISRADPVSFGPGDSMRFIPVTRERASALEGIFLMPVESTS